VSLNLNDPPPRATTSAYYTSPTYTEAVNDAQFVRTFGIVALAGSLLILIGGGVAIGIGMAVMGFGATRYYRVLGLAVVALGILSYFISLFSIIGSAALAAGVAWKGTDVLSVLAAEGKGDPDWQTTRNRATLGIILSGSGLLVSAAWLVLIFLGVIWQNR
jgi:hypothetical protein